MKDFWTKFLCWFIGWNYKLLNECSVASKKSLHRYAGAVMILMLIWAYIGYGMANRYFKLEYELAKVIIAVIFSFMIWMIERQIILIVGKNIWIGCFRFGLAIIMACIGATIIDQTIFGKDIDAQTKKIINKRTDEQFAYEKQVIEEERGKNQIELDSLTIQCELLTAEINKNPTISTYSTRGMGTDSVGKTIYAVEKSYIENPKIQDRERINSRIDVLRNNIDDSYKRLQSLKEDIWQDNEKNIGILTELEVTFSKDVILSGWQSLVFYSLVFGFFLFIECLVVTGKIFSKKCDYEVFVERQQERKIRQIEYILPIDKDSE